MKINKGLKPHIIVSLLYCMVIFITTFRNDNVSDVTQYVLAIGFILFHAAIGMICYLDGYYDSNTSEEVGNVILNAEKKKEDFAIGFLRYVEETYEKHENYYSFKNPKIIHVKRNIIEVMINYKHFLKQHEKQGTQA